MDRIESPLHDHCRKLLDRGPASHPKVHIISSLETGDEALFVRIHLIRSALRTIDIQTFIWANDESGRYVVFELLEAARRGVKVRILIDSWVCLGDPYLLACMGLLHPNMLVQHYNPTTERIGPTTFDLISAAVSDFHGANHRMHSKSFIVDGETALVGGRNYQNDYFDRSSQRLFRDREILVYGPAARDAALSFEDFWRCPQAVRPETLTDFAEIMSCPHPAFDTRDTFELGGLFDECDAKASDIEFMNSYFSEHLMATEHVRYIGDPPGLSNFELNPSLHETVSFIGAAKESILLQSPYFVLDKPHFDVLAQVRKAHPGMRMKVSTNSLASTDNVIAYAHSYRERARYLAELLLEIFELKPDPTDREKMLGYLRTPAKPPSESYQRSLEDETAKANQPVPLCCHAKTFVRDNQAAWIGSANVDPRSAWLNSENAFLVEDPEFSRRVADHIVRDIAPQNSWTVGFAADGPAISALRDLLLAVIPSNGEPSNQLFKFPEDFERKPDGKDLPFYDHHFYESYQSVGSFPLVAGTAREIQVRLISLLPEATKGLV